MNIKVLFGLVVMAALASCATTKSDSQIADDINLQIKNSGISGISAQAKDNGMLITAGELNFAADSAELVPATIKKLDQLADFLKGMDGRKVLFEGHSAAVGDVDAQVSLSRQRAQAVADHFVAIKALKANMVLVEGKGGSVPVGDNGTPEGMAKNRRVEITVLK